MSYVASIRFSFFGDMPPLARVLSSLTTHGWTIGVAEGGIIGVQWLITQGTQAHLNNKRFTAVEVDGALELIERLENTGLVPFVSLHWSDDGTGIEVHKSLEQQKVVVSLLRGYHELEGFEPFKDHTWYLMRLLPAMREIASIDILEWVESP